MIGDLLDYAGSVKGVANASIAQRGSGKVYSRPMKWKRIPTVL